MPKPTSVQHTRLLSSSIALLVVAALVCFVLLAVGMRAWVRQSSKVNDPAILSTGTTSLNKSGTGLNPCMGNEQDECVGAPSIDFWPAGSEGASNPVYDNNSPAITKEIGGIITTSNQSVITLRTTSGRTFTVTYPEDEISWWNQTISPNHQNYQIGIGDTLDIIYNQSIDPAATDIQPSQIMRSSLAIKYGLDKSKGITDPPVERYQP
jgi:hypothetical protein